MVHWSLVPAAQPWQRRPCRTPLYGCGTGTRPCWSGSSSSSKCWCLHPPPISAGTSLPGTAALETRLCWSRTRGVFRVLMASPESAGSCSLDLWTVGQVGLPRFTFYHIQNASVLGKTALRVWDGHTAGLQQNIGRIVHVAVIKTPNDWTSVVVWNRSCADILPASERADKRLLKSC